MMERKVNKRPWGEYDMYEQWVSGNYYPISAMLGIEDTNDKKKYSILF